MVRRIREYKYNSPSTGIRIKDTCSAMNVVEFLHYINCLNRMSQINNLNIVYWAEGTECAHWEHHTINELYHFNTDPKNH